MIYKPTLDTFAMALHAAFNVFVISPIPIVGCCFKHFISVERKARSESW